MPHSRPTPVPPPSCPRAAPRRRVEAVQEVQAGALRPAAVQGVAGRGPNTGDYCPHTHPVTPVGRPDRLGTDPGPSLACRGADDGPGSVPAPRGYVDSPAGGRAVPRGGSLPPPRPRLGYLTQVLGVGGRHG